MDLLSGYDSDDSEEEETEQKSKAKLSLPLPSPDKILKQSAKSSIFKKQFSNEDDELAVLEKHVKMVENKQKITEVNGRKVCWMYRQRRCRFGKNCKMYHDSELRDAETARMLSESAIEQQTLCPTPEFNLEVQDDSASAKSFTSKKRYGVTNTLEPPKKALKQIKQIQTNEFRKAR